MTELHRRWRGVIWAAAALCALVLAVPYLKAQTKPDATAQASPLKLDLVLDMVGSDINSVDILVEAKLRGIAFVVSSDVIQQLTERGADELLLNWLGLYSVELKPQYANCLSEQEAKHYDKVVEISSQLLERSPRLVHLYLFRGAAYRAQNKLGEAVADFRQALKFHRNSSRARVLLAETMIAQKQAADAIAELNWVLEHRSVAGIEDWPTAHRLLAAAYLQRGDYRLASQELHTALWQLPIPNPEAVALLPKLEDHMSALARLLALCPDPSIASPAAAIELATLMKLMSTSKQQEQTALVRLAEGQAATGLFDAAVVTQKAADAITVDGSTESTASRVGLYQKKHVPLLPAGVGSQAAPPVAEAPDVSVTTFLDRMKLVNDSAATSEDASPGKTASSFWIGKYEVTRGEWAAVMKLPLPPTADLPMDRVSWNDCQEFLKRLNEGSGTGGPRFRLPNVSEWKEATQAGAKGAFFFGDDSAVLASYAWYAAQANGSIHRGGLLRENPLGLFDVYGNVAEWCQDEAPISTGGKGVKAANPFRVIVGGSYLSSANQCKTAAIGFVRENEARRGVGLRLVADKQPKTEPDAPAEVEKPQSSVPANPAGLTLAIDYARSTLEAEVFQRNWLQGKLFILLYLQACTRSNLQDIDGAVTNLRTLIREMPDDNSPLMHIARCHLAWIQSTRDAATPDQIAEARKIVESSLTRSEFRLWMGYLTQSAVLVAEKDLAGATRRATQAKDLAPQPFKELCEAQLKAIEQKKSVISREFPIPPSVSPAAIFGYSE